MRLRPDFAEADRNLGLELRARGPQPIAIPAELRAAFADVSRRLPELWPRLPVAGRKTMLRALVSGVNLDRDSDGFVRVRIAWRSGLVGERALGVPIFTTRDTERERHVVAGIHALVDAGQGDATIAEQLNREGLRPCRGARFTPTIVLKMRCRHRIWTGLGQLRRGLRPPGYTVAEMARLIGIHPRTSAYQCR